jgi:hypothetical protein
MSEPTDTPAQAMNKDQVISLYREMLDSWEENEHGKDSTYNFLKFVLTMTTVVLGLALNGN